MSEKDPEEKQDVTIQVKYPDAPGIRRESGKWLAGTKSPAEGFQLARREAFLGNLDKALGRGSEEALKAIKDVAEGTAFVKIRTREWSDEKKKHVVRVEKIYPDHKTRLAAWELLLTMHQGKPGQQIQVQHSVAPEKWDPTAYSDEEWATLEKLMLKGARDTSIVEGQVVEESSTSFDDEGRD